MSYNLVWSHRAGWTVVWRLPTAADSQLASYEVCADLTVDCCRATQLPAIFDGFTMSHSVLGPPGHHLGAWWSCVSWPMILLSRSSCSVGVYITGLMIMPFFRVREGWRERGRLEGGSARVRWKAGSLLPPRRQTCDATIDSWELLEHYEWWKNACQVGL